MNMTDTILAETDNQLIAVSRGLTNVVVNTLTRRGLQADFGHGREGGQGGQLPNPTRPAPSYFIQSTSDLMLYHTRPPYDDAEHSPPSDPLLAAQVAVVNYLASPNQSITADVLRRFTQPLEASPQECLRLCKYMQSQGIDVYTRLVPSGCSIALYVKNRHTTHRGTIYDTCYWFQNWNTLEVSNIMYPAQAPQLVGATPMADETPNHIHIARNEAMAANAPDELRVSVNRVHDILHDLTGGGRFGQSGNNEDNEGGETVLEALLRARDVLARFQAHVIRNSDRYR